MAKSKSKNAYKSGMKLFHKDTKEKITFGKWNADNTGGCITEKTTFINIPKETLDSDYVSYASLEKEARERRRGQMW